MYWLVGGIAVYGAAVGGLYFMQESMIFPRAAAEIPKYPLPAAAEKLTLRTGDGHELSGHLVRSLGASKGLLIGFTGNAWNAGDCLTFIANRVKDWDIAVFHYRGYGASSGEPSEAALFADALQIHDHLKSALEPKKIIGVGFSLGSGVVSYLASERKITGQLLVTPFDSIAAIAQKRYKFAPVRYLLKHPFRSTAYQLKTSIPSAVILASDDKVVPKAHSERLIEHLANPVFEETIANGSHGGIYDMDEIDEVLRRAIDALNQASSGNRAKAGNMESA